MSVLCSLSSEHFLLTCCPVVPLTHLVTSFWFSVFFLQTVLWYVSVCFRNYYSEALRFSRISLLLSVARIFPPGNPVKRNCYLLSVLFILLYVTCMVANTLLCRKRDEPKPFYRMAPHCVTTPGGQFPHGIITVSCEYQLHRFSIYSPMCRAVDVCADFLLVVYPLYVLWKVKLPTRPRRLKIVAFCASTLTLFSAIIYLIFAGVGINMGPSASILRTAASNIEARTRLFPSYSSLSLRTGHRGPAGL